GQAWNLRTLAQAAYITPDSDRLKAHFTRVVNNNLDWYNATYANNPAANFFGAIDSASAVIYNGDRGIAPWQDDFFTSAIGHTAELGFSAAEPSHLLRKDNGTWLLVPRLTWNALDFGRVAASVDSAEAGRDEARAHYRSVVLGALRDADTALARYGHQRQNVVLLRDIEASSGRAASLTRERYDAGTASTLDWLDAERTRFDAEQNRISGDAQLLKDFAALHKALGLGWRT
ncbi:TolC family protein, partial [Pseudomonas sp.]|uniref:TolC family protein n=1 Tax=Pseudomonas sp. TaxID=306 RepID=UPI00258A0053